jgi:hypothetical protein
LLIVALGTGLSCALSMAWILARARWQRLDPSHPGKALALEILRGARARLAGAPENGSRP